MFGAVGALWLRIDRPDFQIANTGIAGLVALALIPSPFWTVRAS
jgi:hypothetical protein